MKKARKQLSETQELDNTAIEEQRKRNRMDESQVETWKSWKMR